MVSNNHDIMTVSVVSIVSYKGIVLATADVFCYLHPRRRVTVEPTLVCIRSYFFTASIGAAIHTFMELKNIWIILCQPQHPVLHCFICVIFLELQNSVVGWCPGEYGVDIIIRPNILRSQCCRFLVHICSNHRSEHTKQ